MDECDEIAEGISTDGIKTEADAIARCEALGLRDQGWQVFHNVVDSLMARARARG